MATINPARAKGWSRTPFGPVDGWFRFLGPAVAVVLGPRFRTVQS